MSAEVVDFMGPKPQRRGLHVHLGASVLVACNGARMMLGSQVAAFDLDLASFAAPDRRRLWQRTDASVHPCLSGWRSRIA